MLSFLLHCTKQMTQYLASTWTESVRRSGSGDSGRWPMSDGLSVCYSAATRCIIAMCESHPPLVEQLCSRYKSVIYSLWHCSLNCLACLLIWLVCLRFCCFFFSVSRITQRTSRSISWHYHLPLLLQPLLMFKFCTMYVQFVCDS